jgi:hypothetical protein
MTFKNPYVSENKRELKARTVIFKMILEVAREETQIEHINLGPNG